MKNSNKTMLAVIVAGLVASALSMHEAQATQIDGTIGFAGTVIFDSSVLQNVTQVNEWHDIFGNGPNFSNVANVTGTYASFRGGIPLGTQVTMAIPWVFTSATPGLWSVRGFTFKLLSARIVMQTGTFLDIIGTGIISHVSDRLHPTRHTNWLARPTQRIGTGQGMHGNSQFLESTPLHESRG